MSKQPNSKSDTYSEGSPSHAAWFSQTLTSENIERFHKRTNLFNLKKLNPEIKNPKCDFKPKRIELPISDGGTSQRVTLWDALLKRQSTQKFLSSNISKPQLGYLLKASVKANSNSHRSVPSAGAFNSTQMYCVVNFVDEIAPGIYLYDVDNHALLEVAIFSQPEKQYRLLGFYLQDVPAVTFVFTSLFQRVQEKYGERGWRYIQFEVGQLMQNFSLVSITQGLGSCAAGDGLDYEILSALDTHSSIEAYMCALHVGPIKT